MLWNNGLTRRNENRIFLLVSVMLSAMILPSIPIHPRLPNIRVEEFLLFSIFGINLILFAIRGFRLGEAEKEQLAGQKRVLRMVIGIFSLMIASYVVSNFYGVYVRGAGAYGLRDVMELVTSFKYFLVLTLVVSIDFGQAEFDFLKNAFLSGLTFLILLGWGQHLNILNMNTWLSPYFNPVHWEHLIVGNPARVLGTFDNPNFFALFTVMTLAFLTVRYFFKDHGGKFPVMSFILIGLVVKLEYLTISRTNLFGIALLFTITCIWAFLYHNRSKKVVIKILALFLLTVFLTLTASSDFLDRVHEGTDFTTSTSFLGHLDRWGTAVGTIWESPVVGWGTQKDAMTTLVDNEYALYGRRYGLVGLSLYLTFFFLPLSLAIKRIRTRVKLYGKAVPFDLPTLLNATYVVLLPSILFFIFWAGIFYNLQLMTLFSIVIGLVYNTAKGPTAMKREPDIKVVGK